MKVKVQKLDGKAAGDIEDREHVSVHHYGFPFRP